MKSMTGFGKDTQENSRYRVEVEIKSVNHRFLDLQIRGPKQINPYEGAIRQLIKETLPRGRVEIFITLVEVADEGKKVKVHWDLVDALVKDLQKEGTARYGESVPVAPILQQLISLPDFVEIQEEKQADDSLEELLLTAVQQAANGNLSSRQQEGVGLAKVMEENRQKIGEILAALNAYVKENEGEFAQRFEKKMQEYLGAHVEQERLLTETALLLERGDIHEELDRLDLHLQKFDELMARKEPVGRELDFLIQEMNREINTIGSKSSAIAIKEWVVQLKTNVEKIREQVQNVE